MATSTERMRRLRERRAAGLLPVPGAGPRDPADLLATAVETTLGALGLGPEFGAAAQLARDLAAAIDAAASPAYALRWLGPELLKVLQALGATPASRQPAAAGPRRPSQLDRLRAEHRSQRKP